LRLNKTACHAATSELFMS